MVFHKWTFVRVDAAGNPQYYAEGSCDSSETKPTGTAAAQIVDGSILVESDTGSVFFFNEKTGAWIEQFSFQG